MPSRTVSLDRDAIEALQRVQARLERDLGFRPTPSIAVKWMASRAGVRP
jgi:hypothetical protein